MKLLLMGLVILGVTALFATQVKDIDKLVEKINKTENLEERTKLLNELEAEMGLVEKEQVKEAQKVVEKKLTQPNLEKK